MTKTKQVRAPQSDRTVIAKYADGSLASMASFRFNTIGLDATIHPCEDRGLMYCDEMLAPRFATDQSPSLPTPPAHL